MATNNINSRIRNISTSIASSVAKKETKKIRVANRYANIERGAWLLASIAAGALAGIAVNRFSEYCGRKIMEVPDEFEIVEDPEMENLWSPTHQKTICLPLVDLDCFFI